MTIATLFLLLALFQLKHFLADYPLQTEYMLGKCKDKNLWILPLLAHVGVHGLFTFVITFIFGHWWLAFVLSFIDMFIHFIMDRLKSSPNFLGKYKNLSGTEMTALSQKTKTLTTAMEDLFHNSNRQPGALLEAVHARSEHLWQIKHDKLYNKIFWVALGFDQFIHHLTDLLIVYIVVTH